MIDTVEQAPKRSIWQVLGMWLKAFDEDSFPTHDDWQDRRIEALQNELAELRSTVSSLQMSRESIEAAG